MAINKTKMSLLTPKEQEQYLLPDSIRSLAGLSAPIKLEEPQLGDSLQLNPQPTLEQEQQVLETPPVVDYFNRLDSAVQKADQLSSGEVENPLMSQDDLLKAQQFSNQTMGLAGVLKGIDKLSSGIAGLGSRSVVKEDPTAYDDLTKLGAKQVADVKDFRKAQDEKIARDKSTNDLARIKRDQDPESEESRIAQDLAKRFGVKGNVSKMTAASFKDLGKFYQDIYNKEMDLLKAREGFDKDKEIADLKSGKVQNAGTKRVDTQFADTYTKWITGNKEVVGSEVQKLRKALSMIKEDPSIVGKFSSLGAKLGGEFLAPKTLELKQLVDSISQKNLKSVFGAQFTQKEGETFLERSFNPGLSPEVASKQIQATIDTLLNNSAKLEDAASYWEENSGTLSGYKGSQSKTPSLENKQTSEKLKRVKDDQGQVRLMTEKQFQDALKQGLDPSREIKE